MMACPTEDILEDIESSIISSDNTVTYKWISQKWNVHVNTAKQLLYSFLNKEKSKENPVNFEVIYFLSGPSKACGDEKSYQVCLVRGKDLAEAKSKLEKVVSEHIYSVQKGSLKDLHELYVVDKADGCNVLQGKSGKGAIKNEEAVPRLFDALLKAASIAKQSSDNKEEIVKEKNEKKSNDLKSKEEVIVNGKTKKDDHKGIAGMFAAQSGKNSFKKSEESTTTIKKPEAKKNGIATFFAKQAERPPVPKVKKEEPQIKAEPPKKVEQPKKKQANGKKAPPAKKPDKPAVVEDDEDPFASEDEEVDRREFLKRGMDSDEDRCESPVEQKKGKASKKDAAPKDKRKKKRSKSFDGEEESPMVTKKRRRIKMMSSSDDSSGEENDNGESESPIPPSPKAPRKEEISDDDEIIPATPQESQGGPVKKRMRKRKMVDKNYCDDKGFIITKKEYVFESCTDDSSGDQDEAKSSKDKDVPNGKLDHSKESKESERSSNNKSKDNDVEMTSPGDDNKEGKGRKSKEPAKGKKTVNKKLSPSNVRQGVLTSFFKRS